MGRLNLLGEQIDLLGGQMPTQLTCYLPPWLHPFHSHIMHCVLLVRNVNDN